MVIAVTKARIDASTTNPSPLSLLDTLPCALHWTDAGAFANRHVHSRVAVTGGSELANTQSFVNDLCALLGVDAPKGS